MSKILIIDDEPDILENLEAMLTRKGFHVSASSGGEEGLALFHQEQPDLVLLDVMMPEIDGIEVCSKIKKNPDTNHIPILLLTALNQVEDKVRGLGAGADDFVVKPFDEAELEARIRAFLRAKELHDQLDQSNRKQKELERLKDSLIDMIVHDLKSPLTSVKGGISMILECLKRKVDFDDTHTKIMENADYGCERILNLIQSLLDISKMEDNQLPVRKTNVNLKELIRHAIAVNAAAYQKEGVKIDVEVKDNVPSLPLDEDLMLRILGNLLANALKFSPSKGRVLLFANKKDPGTVICGIEDSGPGVPKNKLERIFDKFYQVQDQDQARKGHGLGLTFCKMAVERQGGKIWAESEVGHGTRFIMQFPM
jgi:signal transduction histidine kinase